MKVFVNDTQLWNESLWMFGQKDLKLIASHLWDDRDRHVGFEYVLLNKNGGVEARAIVETNRRKIPAKYERQALTGLVRVTKANRIEFDFWAFVEEFGGKDIPYEKAEADYLDFMKSHGFVVIGLKKKEVREKYVDLYKPLSYKRLPKKFTLAGKTTMQVIQALRG